MVQPLQKTVWRVLKKLKVYISTGNEIRIPKSDLHFIAIVKLWKQPKCSSMDEWIKKMCYIHTMENYSAMRKKEIWPFVII